MLASTPIIFWGLQACLSCFMNFNALPLTSFIFHTKVSSASIHSQLLLQWRSFCNFCLVHKSILHIPSHCLIEIYLFNLGLWFSIPFQLGYTCTTFIFSSLSNAPIKSSIMSSFIYFLYLLTDAFHFASHFLPFPSSLLTLDSGLYGSPAIWNSFRLLRSATSHQPAYIVYYYILYLSVSRIVSFPIMSFSFAHFPFFCPALFIFPRSYVFIAIPSVTDYFIVLHSVSSLSTSTSASLPGVSMGLYTHWILLSQVMKLTICFFLLLLPGIHNILMFVS